MTAIQETGYTYMDLKRKERALRVEKERITREALFKMLVTGGLTALTTAVTGETIFKVVSTAAPIVVKGANRLLDQLNNPPSPKNPNTP